MKEKTYMLVIISENTGLRYLTEYKMLPRPGASWSDSKKDALEMSIIEAERAQENLDLIIQPEWGQMEIQDFDN